MSKKGKPQPKRSQNNKNNSLNRFLWLGVLVVGVIALGFVWYYLSNQLVRFDANISQAEKEVIIQALQDWDELYDCPVTVQVRDMRTRPYQENTEIGDRTLATAEPGLIYFNFSAITSPTVLRNTTLHEATHACREEVRYLATPIPYRDGVVLGFNGLGLEVRLDENGLETGFRLCDEALAERNAGEFEGYSVNDPKYDKLRMWMFTEFPDNEELAQYGITNNFEAFASELLGVPIQQLTGQQVQDVMERCQSGLYGP